MKIFRIGFYKAKLGDGKFIDDGISVYTTLVNAVGLLCIFQFKMARQIIKRRYSHVEVWWKENDDEPWFDENGNALGWMFTSTMRQGMSGTVIRLARDVLTHLDRWDVMEIKVQDASYWNALAWAHRQVKENKGYNIGTILNFFNPFRSIKKPKHGEKNICSVVVQGFCWSAGIFKNWIIWSPIKLWWKMNKLGYVTFSL